MSNYNTNTHQIRNNKDFLNSISKQIAEHTTADRQLFITNWVDTLIDVKRASSVTEACKQIGKMIGATHQVVAFYYKGNKTNE